MKALLQITSSLSSYISMAKLIEFANANYFFFYYLLVIFYYRKHISYVKLACFA